MSFRGAKTHTSVAETVGAQALAVLLAATTHVTATYPGFAGPDEGRPIDPPHGISA